MRATAVYALLWIAGLVAALEYGKHDLLLCAMAVAAAGLGRLIVLRRWKALCIGLVIMIISFLYGTWHAAWNVSELPEAGLIELRATINSTVSVNGDRARFHLLLDGTKRERIAATIRLSTKHEQQAVLMWHRGDQVRLRGEIALPSGARNFGQFDYADYLAKRRIHRVLTVEGLEHVQWESGKRYTLSGFLGWIEQYRSLLGDRVEALYPGQQSGFMQGLLIGLRTEMDEALFRRFSDLGLTHIIAISGLHVAIVVGGLLGVMRLFCISRETALLVTLLLIPLYILLSGASPSVVRAGLMGMLALYALLRGILKDALQLLALAAIIMTMWNPYLIYDVSFQLSFLVTAGLITGTSAARLLLPQRGPSWLYNTIAVTVTAQCVSFPLTIAYFNQYALLSGVANFVLVPLFSLIVLPLGYLSLMISFLSMPLAVWMARITGLLNDLCFAIMEQLAHLPGLLSIWPSPPIGAVMLFLACLYALSIGIHWSRMQDAELFPSLRRRGLLVSLSSLVIILGWLWVAYGYTTWGSKGEIAYLDVGQGDAILIRTPRNRTILVDGGGTLRFHKPEEHWRLGNDPYEVGKDLLVPLLKKRGVHRIDYMIVSHGDADHIGGLAAVMEQLPVKRLLFNGTLKDSPAVKTLFGLALDHDVPLYPVHAGMTLQADVDTKLTFLYPFEQSSVSFVDNQNASSVVFHMMMHHASFLFTGDMDAAAERMIVENQQGQLQLAGVDVLKVAHHGSKTSTSELWLRFWRPKAAVISAGVRNRYRHPSPVVTQRLESYGIAVARTDLHGEVQVKAAKEGLTWRAFLDQDDKKMAIGTAK